MRRLSLSLALLALSAAPVHTAIAQEVFESFETGMGAWTVDSHIPSVPPEEFTWSVTRSQAQAHHGVWSLEFFIDGSNDDGNVWITRSIEVPAGTWLIAVEFNVWEPSSADIGIWPRIAFLDTFQPQLESDFWFMQPLSVEAGWTPVIHTRKIILPSTQDVWVAVGLSVNWESINTNYIDSVTVSWTPFPCPSGTCDFGENPCNCPQDCGNTESPETTCDDGLDNDCDGVIDCNDGSCSGQVVCQCGDDYCSSIEDQCNCPEDCADTAESPELTCDDGLDNDCDTFTDCADPDCATVFPCTCGDNTCDPPEDHCNCPQDCAGAESPEVTCDDGIDNDCDGLPDCLDADCAAALVCSCDNGTCDGVEDQCNCPADCPGAESPELTCDDGLDNDCDEATDCADADCAGVFPCTCGDSTCDGPESHCNCPADCPGAETPEVTCDDGIDNDCDGRTDCNDILSCSDHAACLPTDIPAASTWGLVISGLLLVVAATLLLRMDRPASDHAAL